MQRCPHCHHALEDGLLPICWHCGRETQVEPTEPAAAVPAPAKVAPPPLVAKAPEPPVAFGFDQLDEELHFEPGFIEAAIGAPAAPPPMTHAAAATPPPVAATAAAPASKLRVPDLKLPAVKLPAVKLPEMKLPDLKRYRIPLLAVAGLGAVALTLSVMGRPNAATEMTSNPAPAPAPAPSTPAPSAPAPAPAPAPAASAAAPAPPAPAPSVPAPAPEPAPPAAAAVSAPPPAPPAPAPAAVASTPGASDVRIEEAPGWIMPRRAGYASDGSRLLTLQVAALRELQVSRQSIRPILAVRCLSRRTEVFVSLGTSANIESGDTNRVTVQLDEATPTAEQWIRTDTYQELFSPDGLALARQLAGASLMRFTFTPFNSKPVVTEFNVKGFDQHVGTVARTCGWAAPERTNARKR